MRLNKTRIILIIMIVSTIVLGGVAVFVGYRLQQNQISAPTKASSCSCPGGYQGPDKDNKCWSQTETGKTVAASCTGDTTQSNKSNDAGSPQGDPQYCVDICCTPSGGQVGCVRAHYSNGDFNVNGGASFCNNGNHVDGGSCKAVSTTPSKCGSGPACNGDQVCVNNSCQNISGNEAACKAVGGCWNNSGGASGGCTASGDVWCGPGNCVAGRTDLCQYKCVGGTAGSPGSLGSAVNQNVACVAGSCQAGYCLNKTPNSANFGQCILNSGANSALCAGSSNASGSCQLCECGSQCDYNGGQECRKNCHAVDCNVAIPDCGQLDFNCPGTQCGANNINKCANCTIKPTTSTSKSSSTVSSAPIIPSSLDAMIGGRVYCQDTGGQPVPIAGATVAVTYGSTTINATTDADGYYTSSQFSFSTAGVIVAADVATLPSTFNNGLPTSQLKTKFAENCMAATSALTPAGCSTGVTPNFYCDSSSAKSSYANCKITAASNLATGTGFRGFRFKYTNCSAPVPQCGNGTVDAGEMCDPVGSVGQCANGGKCLNGCTCSTCGSTCTTNDQCPNGYACSKGQCRNPACPNANECSCGTSSVPSTALFDDNRLGLMFGFVLILLGIILLRSKVVMSLLTPALVGVFGTSILKYVDPELAKKEYEKSVIESDEE
ncbi:MAG: carboxypeptidase-like regulatory domain-containing protein [bacterium]